MTTPSEATLISNPTPSFAVLQWVPRGVEGLNRRNKLSSLPFWFPNETMKKHQFRFVLLRGVVKEEKEEDDPIAVFLEYLPQPTDGSLLAADTSSLPPQSSSSPSSPQHPKGCKITLRLVNRKGMGDGDRSQDVVEEDTVTFDEDNKQCAFREFITAKALRNPNFSGEGGSTVILEVSILTGVNVVAESVAKGTGQIAGSLWSTFSSFTASVTTLVKKTVQVVQEQREEFETRMGTNTRNSSSNTLDQSKRVLPWDSVPERWVGREASWRHFVTELLVEDENTFLVGSKRGIGSDEQMLMTQYGLNHRAISAADSLFDFDRDVHEGLLTLAPLNTQRYRLVPGKLKDEIFWGNFMWKVASLSTCQTDEQAHLLLTIINAPPPPAREDSQQGSSKGSYTLSSVVGFMQGLAHMSQEVSEQEGVHAINEALEACGALQELLEEEEGDDDEEKVFLESAKNACVAQKDALQKLLKRRGSTEIMETLQQTLRRLEEQIERFDARKQEGKKHRGDAVPSESAEAKASATHNEVPPMIASATHNEVVPDFRKAPTDEDAPHEVKEIKEGTTSPPIETAVNNDIQEQGAPVVDIVTQEAEPPVDHGQSSQEATSAAFGRIPSIDELETPSPTLRKTSSSEQRSTSAKKLEFAPMPWEEDDD